MNTAGQQVLFGESPASTHRHSWCVSVLGRRDTPTTNLPLTVARARAAAMQGYRAVILCTDGTSADVCHEDERFLVTPHVPADWPDVVRRLLDERG